jgi:hypothetical protein
VEVSKDISLVIVDTASHTLAKFAIEQTLKTIDCKEVLVFSDKQIIQGAKHIPIRPNINLHDYSEIMIKHLWLHVETEHALVIQWDAMAVNQHLWTDDFLKYDYIGAIWPWPQQGIVMGNGGFSLRSRKLIEALRDQRVQLGGFAGHNEDIAICVDHRKLLQEEYGIEYAPVDLARQFATENEWLGPTFGFHGPWNIPRFFKESDIRYVIENLPTRFWKDHSKVNAFANTLQEQGFNKLLGLCSEKLNSIE